MSLHPYPRRRFMSLMIAAPIWGSAWRSAWGSAYWAALAADAESSAEALITEFGALPDGATVNTKAIQAAIDHLASRRGGTVVIPQGTFVSGALFFKPRVNLHLRAGAVLQCSTDMANFPAQRTRIEGHFEEKFNPALINASKCDGFHLTGEGTLDGAGRPIWDLFWKLRNASPLHGNFPNVGVPRARLALIENSRDVKIEGIGNGVLMGTTPADGGPLA